MAQSVTLKCRGLWTFPNKLSEIPQGALLEADNVVSDRNGTVESRRGFSLYGDTLSGSAANRAKQLLKYKSRTIRHYDTVLDFDDGSGTFTAFNGSYTETESGLRIKSVEASGNFLFTTNNGIKKISAANASQLSSASGFITDAGIVKAIDATGIIDYDNAGFFSTESKVAYRVVWGIRDANNNLVLGAPSGRLVVTNPSATLTGTVNLTVYIPSGITTNHFFQVYRSAVKEKGALTLDEIQPEDELYLVYESFPTSTDISNGNLTFNDLVPEDFRAAGALLYTNPISGDGILQANDQPPVAKDIGSFKGTTYYANTRTRHQLTFTILSVDDLVKDGDPNETVFTITNGTTDHQYTFDGEQSVHTFTFPVKANINASGYFIAYSASNERKYVIWYDTTGSDAEPTAGDTADSIKIKVDVSGDTTASDVRASTQAAWDAGDSGDFTFVDNVADLTTTAVKNGVATTATDGSTSVGTGFSISEDTAGVGEDTASRVVLLSNNASVAGAIDETARSLVRVINAQSTELVYAYYLSGENDLPGQILLEARVLSDDTFFIVADGDGIDTEFDPSLPDSQSVTITAASNPLECTTGSAHGLSTGDEIVLYNTNTSPAAEGIYTITVTSSTTFTISFNYSTGGSATGQIALTDVFSTDEEAPNRVYYSKYQQPEAVPSTNYRDVGSKDKPILRVIPLRDSLVILKTDGIWRLTGEEGAVPTVSPTDYSAILIAPDSAYVLNNNIYALTTQGITKISDSGVSIISRSIEDQIQDILNIDDVSTLTWGVGYETDRAYLIFAPTDSDDTVATQCFRYNTFTNAWTRFPISKTCGIVGDDDKLYLGAGDTNSIEKERKNYNFFDYADRDFNIEQTTDGFTSTGFYVSSTSNIVKGDAILQTQYVTISQWSRLLNKLDIDALLTDTDYNSTLALSNGNSLSTKFSSLVTKLNADDSSRITQTFGSGDVDTGTETITITSHGFVDNEIVRLTSSGTLPVGLTTNTVYYIINATTNTFQLSETSGGSAVDLTSGGSGTHTITNDYYFSGSTDFETIQTEFNYMITQLNTSEDVFYRNYQQSSGTVQYFTFVLTASENFITSNTTPPFIAGILTVYKAIQKKVIWAPEVMKDPSLLKHAREATLMFEETDFYNGFVGFRTDLSRSVEEVEFFGRGLGVWGMNNAWGANPWGGDGLGTPTRTLIPMQKQRCRYIECQWRHINAFENPVVEGISVTYEAQSTKAYRQH